MEYLFRGRKVNSKEWVYGYYSPRISNVVYKYSKIEIYKTPVTQYGIVEYFCRKGDPLFVRSCQVLPSLTV